MKRAHSYKSFLSWTGTDEAPNDHPNAYESQTTKDSQLLRPTTSDTKGHTPNGAPGMSRTNSSSGVSTGHTKLHARLPTLSANRLYNHRNSNTIRQASAAFDDDSDSALFAPPFYNRPPYLPPSPSFTSLLITTKQRFNLASGANTPDSSENESSVDRASRFAKESSAVERASSVGPVAWSGAGGPSDRPGSGNGGEYYGFVMYLCSSVIFALYVLWAYLPSSALHYVGLYYYPDRWWSLALPSSLVVSVIYIYVALLCYNSGSAPGFHQPECITDSHAKVAVNSADWVRGTDAVLDIPIGEVSRILYRTKHDASEM